MAKKIKAGPVGISILLDPAVTSRTALNLSELPKPEKDLVEAKLNDSLRKEAGKIHNEVAKLLPGKRAALNKLFGNTTELVVDKVVNVSLGEAIITSMREEDKTAFNAEEMEMIN